MAKSKYEKAELLFEQMMQEENLEEKIREMETELESLKGISGEKDFLKAIKASSKEEYREKYIEAIESAKRSRIEKEEENRTRIQEIEKKLKFYKVFKENGNKILNIREYQLANQKRLETLEKELKKAMQAPSLIEKYEKETKKLEAEYKKLIDEKVEINKQLVDNEIEDEAREKLLAKIEKLDSKIDRNVKRYLYVQKSLEKANNTKHRDLNVIESEISKAKVTISKCNVIWNCLLKGKNWDEIQAILSNKDFTAEKGTLNKIRDIKTRADGSKQHVRGQTQKEKEELDKLTDMFGTDNKTKESLEIYRKEKMYIAENPVKDEKIAEVKVEKNEETEKQDDEELKKIIDRVFKQKDEEKVEDSETLLPVTTESFEKRHPILAKIPFLAKIMNKRNAKRINKEDIDEEIRETVSRNVTEYMKEESETVTRPIVAVKDDSKILIEDSTQIKETEDLAEESNKQPSEMDSWKNIADYGWKAAMKADKATLEKIDEISKNASVEAKKEALKEKLLSNKKEAAYRYAEKYKGRYHEQDGAIK